jgi:hypothetical protein
MADDDKINERREAIRARLNAIIPEPRHVIYDAFPRGTDGLPVDNLDEVAASGRVRFFDDLWDKYISEEVENTTWMTVAKLANERILTSGDKHHVFLDGIYEI